MKKDHYIGVDISKKTIDVAIYVNLCKKVKYLQNVSNLTFLRSLQPCFV